MDVKQLLQDSGFRFNKQFGQNFLTDTNLLDNIVKDSGAKNSTVLEIGAGAGTLTRQLSKVATNVIAFEIDRNLEKILNVTLADCNNVKVVIGDVMRYKMADVESLCGNDYKVVANIPYYITTPLLMNFIEQATRVTSLTLTIQKEVAERLCAQPCTKDYGAITVAVQAYSDVTITRILDRTLFYPVPNVDSAVVRIDINRNKYDIPNRKLFRDVVRTAFQMRRKTLVNNLMNGFKFDRLTSEKLVAELGFNPTCRGEELSVENFVTLYKLIERLQ